MTLRKKLLATIGVLCLAAIVLIGVHMWRTPERTPIYESEASAQRARYDEFTERRASFCEDNPPDAWLFNISGNPNGTCGDALPSFAEFCADDGCALTIRRPTGEEVVDYDWATAGLRVAAVALVAIVSAVATVIWTRGDGSHARASAVHRDPAPPTEPAGPVAVASIATEDEVVESLRQLKSLHDDGILTDAEYETKRQALASQL